MKLNWLFAGLIGFVLFSCSSDDPDPFIPGEQRTVLVYWVADNGEADLSRYAISDFNEMLEGISGVDVSKNNLVLYSEIESHLPCLIHITKKKGKVVADTICMYKEQNPLDKAVMSRIFTQVFDKFPAKSYGLAFASHGDGWSKASALSTRYIGVYRNTQMNISDFRSVLERFPRFDFILLDACYMQAIEVAYELRNCTDYVVSSPTEIPGTGAPYQAVVPTFFAEKEDAAIDIANAYYDYYGYDNGKAKNAKYVLDDEDKLWKDGVSISVLQTSKLQDLSDITQKYINKYVSPKEIVKTTNLFYYGDSDGIRYYDFSKLMRQIIVQNEEYLSWKKVFDDVQPYFKTTIKNYVNRKGGSVFMTGAEGVSIYVPQSNSKAHEFYKTLDWYKSGIWINVGW